jgi:hypothetical protein
MSHSDFDHFRLIRSQTLNVITEITSLPQPAYTVDGRTFSWNVYMQRLLGIVNWCDEKIAAAEPYEFRSQAGA